MAKLPLGSLFKIILYGKSSIRFLLGTIFSFSFSMAAILCTIGLMDGFEITLKKALAYANGDIKLTSIEGHFISDKKFREKILKNIDIASLTSVQQVESFALTELGSKGVLVRGVKAKEFSALTGLDVTGLEDGVAIGIQFAKSQNLKVGDVLTLALASERSQTQGAAILKEFSVKKIIEHKIYEKDLRFLYIDREVLNNVLTYKENLSNIALLKIKNFKNLEQTVADLELRLGQEYNFEPYWSEFEVLLNAVKVEKNSISLVLQLIVLIAILNIVAFILYISEIKSQDFFMLKALGLSSRETQKFWFVMLFGIWLISIVVCFFLKDLFTYFIQNLNFLKIPGDVYVLSDLKIILDSVDYLYVYGLSFLWIFAIGFVTMKRITKKSVISGLRQEFS